MELKRYSTKEETQQEAGKRLNQLLHAHGHVPTLFLSSGGSSLELVERVEIFPANFTVGVTDERFSENPKINNFAQLVETLFFQKAQERGASFIDTRVQQDEDLELLSKRMEDAIRSWVQEHPGGRIIITQGVGAHGHTAGMMPYPEDEEMFQELFEEEVLVRGYDAGAKNEFPLRATITMPFLRQIDHSVLYMVGKNKKEAFSRMLAKRGSLFETPARIIHEMKDVHVFTDLQNGP